MGEVLRYHDHGKAAQRWSNMELTNARRRSEPVEMPCDVNPFDDDAAECEMFVSPEMDPA